MHPWSEFNKSANMVALAEVLGMIVWEPKGNPSFTHCPVHGDTGRPNLALYKKGGHKWSGPHVHCFVCGWSGTALDLASVVWGCSVGEAYTRLTGDDGTSQGQARATTAGGEAARATTRTGQAAAPDDRRGDRRGAGLDRGVGGSGGSRDGHGARPGDSAAASAEGAGADGEGADDVPPWERREAGRDVAEPAPPLQRPAADAGADRGGDTDTGRAGYAELYRQAAARTDRASKRYHSESSGPPRNLRPAIEGCRKRLWGPDGQAARDYLAQRGLLEVAAEYHIGLWWDDPSAGNWRNRVVIPHIQSFDSDSPVHYAKGRSLNPECPKHERWWSTSGGTANPYLWDIALRGAESSGVLLVVEGEFDALSAAYALGAGAGILGLPGARNLKEQHIEALVGYELFMLLDNDRAGEEARAAYHTLLDERAYVRDIRLTEHNDLNDMLVKEGVDAVAEFLIGSLTSGPRKLL